MCIWQCPVYKETSNGEKHRQKRAKGGGTLSKLGTPDNFIQKMSLLPRLVAPCKSTLLPGMAMAREWVKSHHGEIGFVTTSNMCQWTICITIYGIRDSELTKPSGASLGSHTEFLPSCLVVSHLSCGRQWESVSQVKKKLYTGTIWKSKTWHLYPMATKATAKHSLCISHILIALIEIHVLTFLSFLHSARGIQPWQHADSHVPLPYAGATNACARRRLGRAGAKWEVGETRSASAGRVWGRVGCTGRRFEEGRLGVQCRLGWEPCPWPPGPLGPHSAGGHWWRGVVWGAWPRRWKRQTWMKTSWRTVGWVRAGRKARNCPEDLQKSEIAEFTISPLPADAWGDH